MTLEKKILTIRESLDKSLYQLKDILSKSNDSKEKEEINEIIETHISYIIFLKELEIEISNKSKGITKEFIIQQFQNILESCKIVNDYHQEKLTNK